MIVLITTNIHKSADTFAEFDPYGISMMIIAMTVVFSSLIILYLIFKYVSKIYNINLKEIFSKKKKEESIEPKKEDTSGEVIVAIASAVFLFQNELHDVEDTVLTIKKIAKTYSPWSSKIYGLRKAPK